MLVEIVSLLSVDRVFLKGASSVDTRGRRPFGRSVVGRRIETRRNSTSAF